LWGDGGVEDMRIIMMSDEYAHKKMILEKLEEAQKQANDLHTKWLCQEDVFGKFREKYHYE
jgi:hypothetical protein